MKLITTLIPDVYELMNRKDGWFTDELSKSLSEDIARRLQVHHNDTRTGSKLRLSQMGPRCPRALWYSYHHPELAEKLPSWAMIKYSYGHILEVLAITLAKAAGHEVTGEQDEIVVDGIVGHRDCVIDGAVCDIKSTSTPGFKKFKEGTLWKDDSFGYMEQLDGYVCGSAQDPLVRVKDKGYILAIDKQLGHMALYEHTIRAQHIHTRIAESKRIVSCKEPPGCICGTKTVGESGNIGLDTRASYNQHKHQCFPGLRTFIYANGPVYLTKVVRKPDVIEVNKYGQAI